MHLPNILCTLLLLMPLTCKAPAYVDSSTIVDITTQEGRRSLAAVPVTENIKYNGHIYWPNHDATIRRCFYSSHNPIIKMNGKQYQGTGDHNEHIKWQKVNNGTDTQTVHTALYETLTEPGTVYNTVHHFVTIRSIWTDGPSSGLLPKLDPDQITSYKTSSYSLTTVSKVCIAATLTGVALICKYKDSIAQVLPRLQKVVNTLKIG